MMATAPQTAREGRAWPSLQTQGPRTRVTSRSRAPLSHQRPTIASLQGHPQDVPSRKSEAPVEASTGPRRSAGRRSLAFDTGERAQRRASEPELRSLLSVKALPGPQQNAGPLSEPYRLLAFPKARLPNPAAPADARDFRSRGLAALELSSSDNLSAFEISLVEQFLQTLSVVYTHRHACNDLLTLRADCQVEAEMTAESVRESLLARHPGKDDGQADEGAACLETPEVEQVCARLCVVLVLDSHATSSVVF